MGTPAADQDGIDDGMAISDELVPGTQLLLGQYTISSFLNAGGFGMTYHARDSLDRRVVIKECFPGAFCRRSRAIVQARSRAHQDEFGAIVRMFVQEARSLSKLSHPNIVGVHQVFEENGTAYMALDFITGRDLQDILEDPQTTLPPDRVVSILRDLLGAISFVHSRGMLHRDISPDNILIDGEMKPVLIDFGAARQQAKAQGKVMSALRVVKDGYSPQEFYITGADQGAYSDLYALAASFHHVVAGEVPPDSQRRLTAIATKQPDPYVPLKGRFPAYDARFLGAIDHALAVLPKDRIQSAEDWLAEMDTPRRLLSRKVSSVVGAPVAQPAPRPRRALLLGGGGVLAVCLAGGLALALPALRGPASVPAAALPATPVGEAAPVVAATALPGDGPRSQDTVAAGLSAERPETAGAPDVNAVDLPETTSASAAVPVAPGPATPAVGGTLGGGWSVALPFGDLRLSEGGDDRIVALDGIPVADRAAFDAALRAGRDLSAAATVTIGLAVGTASDLRTETFAVVHDVATAEGVIFRSMRTDDGWTTRVLALPPTNGTDLRTDLEVGDIVFASVDTGALFDGPMILRETLESEIAAGRSVLRLAVLRDGSNWIATLVNPAKS